MSRTFTTSRVGHEFYIHCRHGDTTGSSDEYIAREIDRFELQNYNELAENYSLGMIRLFCGRIARP